jgi:hypothetical protein
MPRLSTTSPARASAETTSFACRRYPRAIRSRILLAVLEVAVVND